MELLGKGVGDGRPRRRKPVPPTFAGIQFASIGPITSSTLRELGLPVNVEAKDYTIPGLITAVASLVKASRNGGGVLV